MSKCKASAASVCSPAGSSSAAFDSCRCTICRTRTAGTRMANSKKITTPLAHSIDQPIAALLSDLEDRGLLDETLVIFGSEFGRTPLMQGDDGRNHNAAGFTIWLAGGGVRPGQRIGATDEDWLSRGRAADAVPRSACHDPDRARTQL